MAQTSYLGLPTCIGGASRALDQPPRPGVGVAPHLSGRWTTLESRGIFPLHTFKITSGIRLQHPHYIPDRREGDTGDWGGARGKSCRVAYAREIQAQLVSQTAELPSTESVDARGRHTCTRTRMHAGRLDSLRGQSGREEAPAAQTEGFSLFLPPPPITPRTRGCGGPLRVEQVP